MTLSLSIPKQANMLNVLPSENTLRIVGTVVLISGLLLLSKIALDLFFGDLTAKSRLTSYVQRIKTLKNLLQSSLAFGLFAIMILMVMKELGYDIIPFLTGAGLFGLALSFGAQTLIKDIISGVFLIIDNQYNVGDSVKIGDHKGKVYKINLRTTVLKDDKNNLIYIPNSEIKSTVVYNKN